MAAQKPYFSSTSTSEAVRKKQQEEYLQAVARLIEMFRSMSMPSPQIKEVNAPYQFQADVLNDVLSSLQKFQEGIIPRPVDIMGTPYSPVMPAGQLSPYAPGSREQTYRWTFRPPTL